VGADRSEPVIDLERLMPLARFRPLRHSLMPAGLKPHAYWWRIVTRMRWSHNFASIEILTLH
jgi:hypothetical protein